MEIAVLPLALACGVSVLLSAAALLWVALFSSASALRREVNDQRQWAKSSIRSCEEMEVRFLAHKAETTALHESIEGVLDSVERKRRQISASASRADALRPVEPETRDDLVNRLRGNVYGKGA